MTSLQTRTSETTRPEVATAVLSVVAVVLAAWWWVVPGAYPLAAPDDMSLIAGPWSGLESLLLALLGALGTVAALAMRRASSRRPLMAAVAAVEIGVLLGIAADIRVLTLLGYMLALFGPVTVLGVLLVGAWRSPIARWALGGGLLVATGIAVATGIDAAGLLALLRGIGGALPKQGLGLLLAAGTLTAGLLWVWVLIRYLRRTRGRCVSCGRPGAAWLSREAVTRWGRWVTIAAALGPVPYGLVRMTWLTPWPLGTGPAMLDGNPEIRLFGVCLGLAALGGSALTIGLIRPWGEVFPRWIPGLRGRPVPVLLPTVLGTVVGAAVTVAGKSMVQVVAAEPAEWPMLLIFPFPLWGPLLVAASLAYYLRRRGRCTTCGQG